MVTVPAGIEKHLVSERRSEMREKEQMFVRSV
jgi:hypothetical protein